MRRRGKSTASQPIRNRAHQPRFGGYATTGLGHISNDRFTGNCTYTDVTGASDGPTLPDGTVLTRYARLTITTGRSRLGFQAFDPLEGAVAVPARQMAVTPGDQVPFMYLVRSSIAATVSVFARGANGTTWVDAASVSVGSTAVAANTWTWITGVYTVPAGVTTVSSAWWAAATLATGVVLETAALCAGSTTYIDGYMAESKWTGTTNDSESVGYRFLTPPAITNPWLASVPTLLPHAPPTLSSPVTINIDDTSAKRHITLAAGQDAIIVMPNTAVTDIESVFTYESLITVYGGRNVVLIGGRITIPKPRVAKLAAAISSTDTTLLVDDTTGYPAKGELRVEGEGMTYTSKDATHFYLSQRHDGFFNSGTGSSDTTHGVNANVYISERHRSAISFKNQTGIVHVEGLLIDGFVNDGIRISGGTGTLRVQRCRIEGVTNYDLVGETDGHPDGMQAYGGGCAEIDVAQVSIILAANGNGIINKGSDSAPSTPVGLWRFYDFEIVAAAGNARSMFANSDGATSTFDVYNAWLRYGTSQTVFFSSGTGLRASFSEFLYRSGQTDIVPASSVGIGYVSPGYSG